MKLLKLAMCLGALVLGSTSLMAAQININFDSITPGHVAGDSINDCVVFSSARSNDASPLQVGGTVSLFNVVDGVRIDDSNVSAISDPNFVLPNDGSFDVLMDFSANPIRAIALTTDEFFEGPEDVNLIALTLNDNPATTEIEYDIIDFDTGSDDATSPPDNRLFIDGNTPISFVLFQGGFNPNNVDSQGRELEGFDDLRFVKFGDPTPLDPLGDPQIPEPSTLVLAGLALSASLVARRGIA